MQLFLCICNRLKPLWKTAPTDRSQINALRSVLFTGEEN